MADVNPSGWEPTDSIHVRYTNSTDTTTLRNISILMRTNSKFSHDELALSITTKAPDGECVQEICTLNTTHPTNTLTNHKEYCTLYRTSVVLSQIGDYTFTIAPRPQSVVGVIGVGVKIDRPEQ